MIKNRVDKVLANLEQMGMTQMLICDHHSIAWLTGFYMDPYERFFGLLLDADGNHVMFLNNLFYLDRDLGVKEVWYADTDPIMEIVAGFVKPGIFGVDKELKARFLMPLMEHAVDNTFRLASLAVDHGRAIKDADEQEKMIIASQVNDQCIDYLKALIKPGVTEIEVASKLKDIYVKLGAQDNSFQPIVAFGPNAADGHHESDETVLKEGDCVLFDVGCIKDGYCSDMTRTFFYKYASDAHKEVYHICLKAQLAAEAIIKPGVRLCDIDAAARDIITEAGYGPNFNHRLGHFIGTQVHEYGDVSSAFTDPVKPGMIFSIEPGIYLAGDMGVRIEDLVLVTEDGCKILNHYSKELAIID